MIFVVCKYENWARYWFNQFAARSAHSAVKARNMTITLNTGTKVKFIGEHRFESLMGIAYNVEDVIYWGEFDESIDDLEALIERRM